MCTGCLLGTQSTSRYLTFKAIHDLASGYSRSNNELLLAPLKVKTRKTLGDRSFAAAPAIWNKLSIEVRAEDNFILTVLSHL